MPVCPEMEIGLGTPREPIELVDLSGRTTMVTVESRRVLTDTMVQFAQRKIEALAAAGIIGDNLKKKPPNSAPARGYFTRGLSHGLSLQPSRHQQQFP